MTNYNGRRVLVIDDARSIRETLSLFLRDEGYNPYAVELPSQALTFQQSEKIELALIDVNLPEMDGLHLAEIMLKNDPELTVVFITGLDSFDNMIKAIRLGAYDYLKKPLLPGELTLALERFEERKILRSKIRQAEKLNTMLVQNIPVMLLTINEKLNITSINHASLNMLGYTPQECVADSWLLSRLTENDRNKLINSFHDALKKGITLSTTIKIRHRNNHFVYALFQSLPKFPDDPEKNGMRCAVTDITDRILLEKKMILDEKLKTMGAITAEVAHEIRNPLMSIGGFARRLQNRFPNLAEADIIVRESYRLEKILNRINNYLSPIKFENVECNAVSILKECLELLEPQITEKKINFHLDLDESLPTVYADPDLLRQVFINMILGCYKNIEAESRLEIVAGLKNDNLEIRFSIPSPGQNTIEPEKIFTPFEDGGLSIGIPLTYRLINKMNGELNFLTEDCNAIFLMTIPCCKEEITIQTDKPMILSCMPENPAGPLESLLQREWLRSAREMKPLGVVTLEVENTDIIFADITDVGCSKLYGIVFTALQDTLKRAGDFLSSCGTRTFVAVLPGTDNAGAKRVAKQLRQTACNKISELTEMSLNNVSVQTGTAAEIPTPEHIPDELIDKALYNMRTGK